MDMRGIGDRWLADETIDGVGFRRHDIVEIMTGKYEGEIGRIELLMDLAPEARYLVKLTSSGRMVPVAQSALQRADLTQ